MTKSATREKADEVSAPIASPVFTGTVTADNLQVSGTGVSDLQRSHSTTTASLAVLDIKAKSTGDMAAGFGSAARFIIEDTANVENVVAEIAARRETSDSTASLTFTTSATEAMRINADGIVTTPNQPSFKVNGSNVAVDATGFGVVPFNLDSGNDSFDNGNNYNTTNYRFVAPVAGKYFVAANVRMDSMSGTYFRLLITKNGSENTNNGVHSIIGSGKSTNYHSMNVSGILNCAANDYLEVKYMSSDDTDWDLSLSEAGFSGFLIG
jgi:hypothetical protein